MRVGGKRTAAIGLGVVAALAAPRGWAQTVPPLPGIIDRVAPVEQPRLRPSPIPDLPEARRGPGEDRVLRLRQVRVTDATVLPPAALEPAVAGLAGEAVPLRRIEEARIALLAAFRAVGYPFVSVNAGLTPLPDGAFDLRFSVTEAEIVEIRLDGDIGPAATQALRFVEPLRRMGPIPAAALERALLLVSDIPGVSVQGVLQPVGDAPGALRLVLRLDRQPFSGLLSLDNRAFRQTGPWQGLLVLQANSFSEFGERTELSLYGTEALSQRFGQISSEFFAGASGLRLRLFGGHGTSEPRGPLAALGYEGTSTVAGIGAFYPLVRSRPANLALTGQFDIFDGAVDIPGATIESRDELRTLRLGAQGQALDPIALGPLPLGATFGQARLHLGLGGDTTRSSRAGAQDSYTRLTAELTRSQPLAELAEDLALGVQFNLAGQWSSDVLPPAEKFLLGGARITRGYYSGQASGDSGWAAGAELQLDRGFDLPAAGPVPAIRLQAQGYLFYDHGRATQNLAAERDVELSSFGGGVRFFLDRSVQLEFEVARRLERRPDGAGTAAIDPLAAFVTLVVRY